MWPISAHGILGACLATEVWQWQLSLWSLWWTAKIQSFSLKLSTVLAFIFPWNHPLSASRERTDLSVCSQKDFWVIVMPIGNTRKAVYLESGPRKKVGLDEGHRLMSFVLIIGQASHHKASWRGQNLQMTHFLWKSLTEAARGPVCESFWLSSHSVHHDLLVLESWPSLELKLRFL